MIPAYLQAYLDEDGVWATLPDGVYLELPQEAYFAQDALGSTDLMSLYFYREGWWMTSRHNKRRQRKTTAALTYGSALHAIILEGVAAYEARFAAEPDWENIPNLIDTVDEIKQAIKDLGYETRGTKGWKKSDWIKAIRDSGAEHLINCKSLIQQDFLEDIDDRTVVSATEDEMLRYMRDVMLDPSRDDNEDFRAIFGDETGYPPLAEVSILHTQPNGVRRRWRIDRMFPSFDVDLKSLGNWSGRPLEHETGSIIAKRGYDIQRGDYKRGRTVAYEYIRRGQVFGGSAAARDWLATWPDQFPVWDWKWIFYQKADPAGRAAVLFPVHDDNDSLLENYGRAKAQEAMRFYLEARDKWGFDKPWAKVAPLHYTDEAYRPNPIVQLPHFISPDGLPTDQDAWTGEDL